MRVGGLRVLFPEFCRSSILFAYFFRGGVRGAEEEESLSLTLLTVDGCDGSSAINRSARLF